MSFAILLFLAFALASIGALSLVGPPGDFQPGQPHSKRSVWSVTLATPSLLVPTLATAVATWIFLEIYGWNHGVSENPFGLRGMRDAVEFIPVLVVMSTLVAGFVGLLTAYHRFGKADGGHFWEGIKNHTVTFLLAKAAICGWAAFLSDSFHVNRAGMLVLYLAPSLLLAPLLGTAALNPRRPLRAIKAAVDRTWDLRTTSRLILFQTLACLVVWLAFTQFGGWNSHFPGGLQTVGVLAQESSALSFNPLPMLNIVGVNHREPIIGVLCAGLLMFLSTAFMHAHFRRVMQRPHR